MQRLLIRSGYRVCGFVEELDPGDPEVVFFKKLTESIPEANDGTTTDGT
jgi:hypothetical protein